MGGGVEQEKSVKALFEAFDNLNPANAKHFHMLVVGDGPQREQLRDLSRSTKAVSWLRYISAQDELAAVYRAVDLFVHPGVQETFGLVALEAQACGTPVVGIRGSYMDRIILSDQTHWAEDNSPDSLAVAILESKKLDLAAIGEAASQQVAKRYSWLPPFLQMFDIYGQLRAV